MKKIFPALLTGLLFGACGTPKPIKGTNTGPVGIKSSTSNSVADTVSIIGTQYLPVEGRSETGVRPDLRGTWELAEINGKTVVQSDKLNVDVATKAVGNNADAGKKYNENEREIKRDSVVTKTKNGTQTETTVYLMNNNRGNNITPPQGTNYHIPAKPSISFYGANETFSGFTGCNKISGRYAMSGKNSISFQNAEPSTKMVCIGDFDENIFLDALHSVNAFKSTGDQLELMNGDKVVLTFTRKQ